VGLWRYSVGHKGISRVTVFEREDSSCLYVEWWDDDGRHKQALKTVLGQPVTDQDTATEIADRMSKAQERKRNQQAAEMLGLPTPRSLEELFAEMHAARSGRWSEGYTRDQERYRTFWLDRLGDVVLTRTNAAVVERIVRREVEARRKDPRRRNWSARTQGAALRYIVDAYSYAERKLKWIEPKHNLSAVDIPAPKGRSEAYTLSEARKLLPALETVDWRAGWIGYVSTQTGRRLTAVRTLPRHGGWVELHDGYAVLQFPGATDKARNAGQAVVSGDALRLTRYAMLRWDTPTLDECRRWIRKAERAAGVPYRPRRGWHGLKRLYATLAKGHVGREKQSGTTGVTLDRVYLQDELEPKVELARALADRLSSA
jgi:hypothetical protein